MLRPTHKTAPDESPISLDEAKAHCRVDFTDDDALIAGLIDAAIARVDGHAGILGRCMITQVWTQAYPCWGMGLRLPFPDVASVVIRYRDADDVEQTLPAEQFELVEDARGGWIAFRDAFAAPTLNADRVAPISIDLTAGYGSAAESVPASIRHALLMMVAHWYETREAVTAEDMESVPLAVEALLAPHRRFM